MQKEKRSKHPTSKNAVIYARVLSKEQEKEGFSIPAQLKLLNNYAAAQGFSVVQKYVDVETAEQTGRPGFMEMVNYFKKQHKPGVRKKSHHILLVEKTDRLYRDLKDWAIVNELDLEIHFVSENFALFPESRSSEKSTRGLLRNQGKSSMHVRKRNRKSAHTIKGNFPHPYEMIELTISALPEAWKYLYWLSKADPKTAGKGISILAEPVFNDITAKPATGMHSGTEVFMPKMKILIAYLHRWIFYWFKNHDDEKEWPGPLRDVVDEIRNETGEKLAPSDTTSRKAFKTTAYIMEKFYGDQRTKHRIKRWTHGLDSFRRSYLSRKNNNFIEWFERDERYFPPIYNGSPIITKNDPPGLIDLLKSL